jgi:hypothetical protein
MRFQLKNKLTKAEWLASDFILARGEAGIALDTGEARYGNGSDRWVDLPETQNPVESVAGRTGVVELTKEDVGLDNVDNTDDLSKPISNATNTQLIALNNRVTTLETDGVGEATKIALGIENVDNTHDIDKPISSAAQIALNNKAPLNSPVFTGTVQGVTKSMVGLAQVDNTSDLGKPISTATQTALNAKLSSTDPRLSDTRTPTDGTVTDAKVAADAAINLDKTADTATRIAMTPNERSELTYLTEVRQHLDGGLVVAGDSALSATDPNTYDDRAVVAIGSRALENSTETNSTVAVGIDALRDATRSIDNVAIGAESLRTVSTNEAETTGVNNVAIGKQSGLAITGAADTISIGRLANAGTTIDGSIGIGRNAGAGFIIKGLSGDWETHGESNTPGAPSNVAVGNNALARHNIGGENLAAGEDALQTASDGIGNVALGSGSLKQLGINRGPGGTALTTVSQNGTYTWTDSQITFSINTHGVEVGDYVQLAISGGSFEADASVNGGNVRGLVNSIIDANSFTVAEVSPGVPVQDLEDVGNATLVSYERGVYSDTASYNIGIGHDAGSGVINGDDNIFVGNASGPIGMTEVPAGFISVGSSTLASVQTGSDIIAIGSEAASETVENADGSIFVGARVTAAETSVDSVVVGTDAAVGGSDSVSVGSDSVSGVGSVSIGSQSVGGDNAVTIGHDALASLNGVVVGGAASATGSDSVVVGNGAEGAYDSVAVGDSAFAGDGGIAIGSGAVASGNGIAIGTGVVVADGEAQISTDAHATTVSGSSIALEADSLEIGTSVEDATINVGGLNSFITIGESNVSGIVNIKGQLVTIDDAGATSDRRDKTDIRPTSLGLDFVNSLRPVEFRWNRRDESTEGTRFHQGFIAQEVKEAADDAGVDFGGYVDQSVAGGPDQLMLRKDELISVLTKAVQELSAKVEQLEDRFNNG